MELRHLRYFVVVGEEQHFGRAADRLRVAQPALSRQIQDLEKELGFVLFERLPRGVRLNAAGKLFLTDARRILQDVEEAKLRAERIAQGKAGTLRIGIATAVSWHGMVVNAFRKFRRQQPDVELELHHLLSVHQVDAILSGRLDAGLMASLTPWNKDLAHLEFAQDRMVLAVPAGHPLVKRKRVRLRDLRDLSRSNDAGVCARRPTNSTYSTRGTGSRHESGTCPVSGRNRVDDRIHPLALSARHRFTSCC
jgi:DNA-binding transcriptional LysR family regulator